MRCTERDTERWRLQNFFFSMWRGTGVSTNDPGERLYGQNAPIFETPRDSRLLAVFVRELRWLAW